MSLDLDFADLEKSAEYVEAWRRRLIGRVPSKVTKALPLLIEQPVVNAAFWAKKRGIQLRTAQLQLIDLCAVGVLDDITMTMGLLANSPFRPGHGCRARRIARDHSCIVRGKHEYPSESVDSTHDYLLLLGGYVPPEGKNSADLSTETEGISYLLGGKGGINSYRLGATEEAKQHTINLLPERTESATQSHRAHFQRFAPVPPAGKRGSPKK
jgi:hypothetical protein